MIAVTGATGFVGANVLRVLRAQGVQAIGIGRDPERCDRVVGDMGGSPDWNGCLRGIDTVIHCAAVAHVPLSKTDQEWDYLCRVNVAAVESLASACLEQGVRRLLFLSSVKVYGESSTGRSPFHEEDELNPHDAYGRSKCMAEERLRACRARGLDVCSIRLPLVYGPGAQGNVLKLQRMIARGLPLPFGAVENRRSFLDVDYLGVVICSLLAMSDWPYPSLNIADPDAMSLPEFIRLLGQREGYDVCLFRFPVLLLRTAAVCVGAKAVAQRLLDDLELDTGRLKRLLSQRPPAQ